jgi:Xaa-Pro dipeptidase
MSLHKLFADHIATVSRHAEKALAHAAELEASYDGIVFHAGKQDYYHADDRAVDFRPLPHFARFAPIQGPEHLLLYRPHATPRLFQVAPADFWYEPPVEPEHPYGEVLDVVRVASRDEAAKQMGDLSRCAYVGNAPRAAAALGVPLPNIEPKTLMAALDWYRGFKTAYEAHCIREANEQSARGHQVVREGFGQLLSERHLHAGYLDATGLLEYETPYTNIIAWDAQAATLHYQSKRAHSPNPGAVLLIDAGGVVHGYASDITRTYANDRAPTVFHHALDRMEEMQQDLVRSIAPGRSYVELQTDTHRGTAAILCDLGILNTDPDAAMTRQLTLPFMPHGVGHHLGLQVHDVGGRQTNPQGEQSSPPPEHPFLRTTRELDTGHVVTVEPGLYFIPMLLEPHRSGAEASAFNWTLIDELIPYGGIRIEDDILVTSDGFENLTRPFCPGHRDT